MTPTTLDDVLDVEDLAAAIDAGYVREQRHPELPLRILNYTETCQFARAWTPTTLACRGLIVDDETGEVLARPFPKFFNHDEPGGQGAIALDEPVEVTDKLDGSLGITYPDDHGAVRIATRGSFTSDQALHATRVWHTRYADTRVSRDWTLLFEIIYPENRIVVDYGQQDDLVLLGAREIASGRTIGPGAAAALSGWTGPVAEVLTYSTLADALAAAPRAGMEGFVVRSLATDTRVKIKQEEYVRLHRIITHLSTRSVWEHLGERRPLDELLEPLPEEFHPWVRDVAAALEDALAHYVTSTHETHERIIGQLPEGWTRKDYALVAKNWGPVAPWLFRLLDGRDLFEPIWKSIKPERAMATPGAAAELDGEAA